MPKHTHIQQTARWFAAFASWPLWARLWTHCTSRYAALLGIFALSICLQSGAHAHPTSQGVTIVYVDPDAKTIKFAAAVSQDDLGEFLRLDTDGNNVTDKQEVRAGEKTLAEYMSKNLSVTNDTKPCTVREERIAHEIPSRKRFVHFVQTWACADPLGTLALSNRILFDDRGGHRHFARIQLGERIRTTTFAREFPTYTLQVQDPRAGTVTQDPNTPPQTPTAANPEPSSLWSLVVRYTWEGTLHIWIGIDHILFVLCLLFIAHRWQALVLTITAFTLGHSVTLTLSALNLVSIPASIIEPIIALSIAVVAAENIALSKREDPPPHRPVLTFFFGLVHGFGFAYVLRDDVGLPTETLVPALLTFNLGVELGQLAIVLVAWPLLHQLMKRPSYPRVVQALSGLAAVVALYWFVERTFLS